MVCASFNSKIKKTNKSRKIPISPKEIWKLEFARNVTSGKAEVDLFLPGSKRINEVEAIVRFTKRPYLELSEKVFVELESQENIPVFLRVSIPNLTPSQRMARYREVLRLTEAGWGQGAIAVALDASNGFVSNAHSKYQAIKDMDPNSPLLYLTPPAIKALKKLFKITDITFDVLKEKLENDKTWPTGMILQRTGFVIAEIYDYCAENGIL